MTRFIEWLTSLNWTALATMLGAYLTVNAGTLIGLVIGWVRVKVQKNQNAEEMQLLQAQTRAQYEELKKLLIQSQDEATRKQAAIQVEEAQKRLEIIKQACVSSDEADKKLIVEQPSNIDEMLDAANE